MKRLLKIINEKSTNRRFRKQATMIAGMSAMVVTKMELQRLKEKLPNISIRYTGTWKDSLKFGVGMAATAAGIILALLGCGSEILTGGVSTAVSVPAAASGIAIAGTGLAISGSALTNMFDVRIQKSESSKGDGEKNAEQENNKEYKKPKRGSGKEKANDVPSWARGEKPYKNENGKQFADRLLDEKYGKGNYSKGPGSEYNQIRKWGDRGFE